MPRRYRKRRKFLRYQIKQDTIFTILAVLLIAAASLTTLSFFQSGSVLISINSIILEKLGWLAVFLPLVLVTTSFLFIRIKLPFSRTHVSIGMLLVYFCLLGLAQGGTIGQYIWKTFALSISDIGTFIVLAGLFFIGLVVMFNTSIDEIIRLFITLYKQFIKITSFLPAKKKSAVYVEKLPIRPPSDYKKEKIGEEKAIQIPKPGNHEIAPSSGLGSSVIQNAASSALWEFPPLSLLSTSGNQKADRGDMKQNAGIIEKTLESFGISARVVEVNLGPAVTQYSIELALGTKLSKITALSSDLALALAAPTGQIRIEAPIPGRSLVGIEIPNRSLEYVNLYHMLSSDIMKKSKSKLQVALGLDVSGEPITANISKMPHVLIAGTTGSGKSVLINSWVASLLFRATPSEVRLIMVDPKRVESSTSTGA